jgi:hypothetical protein
MQPVFRRSSSAFGLAPLPDPPSSNFGDGVFYFSTGAIAKLE